MAEFKTLTSRVVPLAVENVDTDQVVPARFLKVTEKDGLADACFADWRKDPSFILNKDEAKGAQILLAGDNFGCGSSREHAPWSLVAFGFRAVISTSFADIFRNNALKNGLVPVVVPGDVHEKLFALRDGDKDVSLTVDLEAEELRGPDGLIVPFKVDDFARHCLLNGIDELGYIQSFGKDIEQYEARSGA